jgi:hypothetical protein
LPELTGFSQKPGVGSWLLVRIEATANDQTADFPAQQNASSSPAPAPISGQKLTISARAETEDD